MAKFDNILNNAKERENFSEFDELSKFMRFTWHIIQCSEHSDPKTTEFTRYENAMKALFGSNYSTLRKPPEGFTYEDMREIVLQRNEKGNLEGAIKKFLQARQTPIKTEDKQERDELEYSQEMEFEKNFDKIKQHIYQAKYIYEGEDFEEGRGFPWGVL